MPSRRGKAVRHVEAVGMVAEKCEVHTLRFLLPSRTLRKSLETSEVFQVVFRCSLYGRTGQGTIPRGREDYFGDLGDLATSPSAARSAPGWGFGLPPSVPLISGRRRRSSCSGSHFSVLVNVRFVN